MLDSLVVAVTLGVGLRASGVVVRGCAVLVLGLGPAVVVAVFVLGGCAVAASVAVGAFVGIVGVAGLLTAVVIGFVVVLALADLLWVVGGLGLVLVPVGVMAAAVVVMVGRAVAFVFLLASGGLVG
ncbi:hypothetical protein [Thioalkalivibrio sp. AKL8]|uniref:hypothetical protein n=1 Tax=Thioalkalivibrio sp. AKL8 TaxID=1158156 RepID=UPI0012DC69F1|nr:hypothetical protein [Thioalkalivibrio sp. AKL8]